MTASSRKLATRIRRHAVEMTARAKSSHVGTALSAADILAVLYGGVLRIDPAAPTDARRDRFVLSKGHGCVALYAALAESGFFPVEWLETFYQNGSRLAGHVTVGVPGVEASTGALGHGLPICCGLALASRRGPVPFRVVTLMSDGECDEGSVWEAALFAAHHRLDNLTAIIDYNKIQSLGAVDEIMRLEPFAAKWEAFGWTVREIDGHDHEAIQTAFDTLPFERGRPNCLIAHTIKGKGVSFMENTVLWHYRSASDEELRRALGELEPPE